MQSEYDSVVTRRCYDFLLMAQLRVDLGEGVYAAGLKISRRLSIEDHKKHIF